MNKLINYLKLSSIFIIVELFITFFVSILNLIGINTGISQIIILIFNIVLFFYLSYKNAKKCLKRGYMEGMILSLIFILEMYLIKLILFNSIITITTIIYYIILIITSMIAGMISINKKEDK